jgi:hypothetical protein
MITVVLVILGAILIWPPMQEVVRMGSRENLAVLHIMRENIMTDPRSTQEAVSLLLRLTRISINGQQRNAKKPVVS